MNNIIDFNEDQLLEIIEIIDKLYGQNFEGYSDASLRRRILRLMGLWGCNSYVDFKLELTSGKHDYKEILNEITVNTTEMFRDASIYKALKENVFPRLSSYPQVRIWHAGCSTGEEVYSFAILLYEAGLLNKTIQYGTDLNSEVLEKARAGIYGIKEMKQYSQQYLMAGGMSSLSDYYTTKYEVVKMKAFLKKNMVFSENDLINGAGFNQFEMIVCRNVFIYFKQEEQDNVLKLFLSCLKPFGILVLGAKESILFSKYRDEFDIINKQYRIFKKKI